MINNINLILASASPRRAELLKRLGLSFDVLPSHIDEEERPGASPVETVLRLAQMKARAAETRTSNHGSRAGLVLAADTVIEFAGRLLGKPSDPDDAVSMLMQLGGRRHRVVTAVCVMETRLRRAVSSVVASEVTMRSYSREEARRYARSGEPLDKAGSYAIQGRGAALIAEWSGCYYNIIGLPLCETARLILHFEPSTAIDASSCRLPDGSPCPRLVEPCSGWILQAGDQWEGEHP
jgi:septum formation protein